MVLLQNLLSLLTVTGFVVGDTPNQYATQYSVCNPGAGSVYQFNLETLDKRNVSMSRYAGSVLLIVNVATYCAYTEQYLDLNPMANQYRNMSFYIAGFPCNQFGLQEPSRNNELLNGIQYVRPGNGYKPVENFHIYGKLEVNDRNAHPMYKFLKKACPPTGEFLGIGKMLFYDEIATTDIVWNFEKFIIDRQGRPRYRFHPDAWDRGLFVEKYLLEVLAEKESTKYSNAAVSPSQSRPSPFGPYRLQ